MFSQTIFQLFRCELYENEKIIEMNRTAWITIRWWICISRYIWKRARMISFNSVCNSINVIQFFTWLIMTTIIIIRLSREHSISSESVWTASTGCIKRYVLFRCRRQTRCRDVMYAPYFFTQSMENSTPPNSVHIKYVMNEIK